MSARLIFTRRAAACVALACLELILWRGVARTAENASSADPVEALQRLLDGNQRFVNGSSSHPYDYTQRRIALAKGQSPFAAILACSDSRSSPEIIFDQGLGDLFVVRLAGNVADPVAIDSIDYAVHHLGSRLVMVLGHNRCGAVTAAVKQGASHGRLTPMLKELQPAVAAARGEPGDSIENAIRANVRLTVDKLKQTASLREMVESGELKVVGARYDLDTGVVELLSE